MSPKNKIEELFKTIKESKEYKEYQKIIEVINDNEEIKKLVNNIKELQQESVRLEHKKNIEYKELNKKIETKLNKLNSIPLYKEYLRRTDELNNLLSLSSYNIEKYINSKI